jgi:hypothetical protein
VSTVKVLRLSIASALVAGGLIGLSPATAQAAGVVNATLVKTTLVGGANRNATWTHPSPDPSGIAYNSRTDELIISDGEVEETQFSWNVWKGTNLFIANRQGNLLATGRNTMAYSAEPAGVGFRPTLATRAFTFPERLFVSDDDKKRVFEVNRGTDGAYGTADDTQTSFSVKFTDQGPVDAEDVAVDLELTRNGNLLIIDGTGKRAFVYNPGPDHVFNGQAAAGHDDTVDLVVNLGNMGAGDPEGIAYNPNRDTMFVLDDPSNQIYEVNMQGQLQNIVKLPFTLKSGAGIALAPPSNNSGGAWNAYIVDRGVDNDTNGTTFNDGRLFEVAIPGLTGTGSAPTPTTPPSTGGTGSVDAKIVASADDAEQVVSSGTVTLGSGDLNLPLDGTRAQMAGMRFSNVTVPQNATITKAYVQFQADEVSTGPVSLTISGELTGDAAAFTTAASSVSTRSQTGGVTWTPADWPTAGARTAAQQTADLSSVVKAIVSQAGWASGNHLVLTVKSASGTGTRVAESFDGGAAKAPVLHIEYTAP